MDALAVAVKSDGGGAHLHFVERNDFNLVVCQPLPKLRDSRDAVATAQNTRGFMRVDRLQDATFVAVDDVLEGLLFRFVEKNGDQGRAIDHNHRALRSSMISCGERGSRTGMAASSATN
jgi:hypothetical protein